MSLAFLDVSSKKGAYGDISHIILKHTQQTQVDIKISAQMKEGKVITATNMCSNFGGFRYSQDSILGHSKVRSQEIAARLSPT